MDGFSDDLGVFLFTADDPGGVHGILGPEFQVVFATVDALQGIFLADPDNSNLTVFHFHAGLDEDDILGGNAGQTEHDLFDFIGGDDFDEDILGDGEDDDEFDLDDIMGAIEVDDSMSNADLLHDTFDSDDEI